ncbi:MAG TPA: hypothetical protein VG454_12585 [Gemmatimonadales bacterium]|nr:hypothetical protein [Gemmatimonadales bacterium]
MNCQHRLVITVSAALVFLAGRLTAQDTTMCRYDTLGHTFTDTITIGLAPGRPPNKSQPADTDYLLAAQAVQSSFRRPAQVRLPLWARTASSRQSDILLLKSEQAAKVDSFTRGFVPYGLYGRIRFRLDPTGRLADTAIVVDFASPEVRDSIIAAVKHADSALAFGPPSRDVLRDHGNIRLQFVAIPYRRGPSVALLRIVVPALLLEEEAKVESFPHLTYPHELIGQGLGDSVFLRFVVRADGRIDPSSIDLVEARYRDFAVEAIRGLENARFRPAHIATCALPTVASTWVKFVVRRPDE